MFFSNDVINLKWQQGNLCRDVAILATKARALPDKLLQHGIHAALTVRVLLASARGVLLIASVPPDT